MSHVTYTDLIAGIAVLALLGVVVDGYLAVRAGRESARALVSAHVHPGDRRQRDTGPPPDTPERRAHHRAPDNTRARRRDHDDPQWITVEEPLTEQRAAEIRAQLRRSQLPDRDDLDPPPTRDMRAIPPRPTQRDGYDRP